MVDVIHSFEMERHHLLEVCRSLSSEEFAVASDCSGWRVQDVIAHLASTATCLTAPWHMRFARGAEATNDKLVDLRRSWTPGQVVAEYERSTGRLLRLLKALQRRPLSRVPVYVPEFGSFPARMLANAAVFDTHLHLRHDILGPSGPISREVPDATSGTVAASVEWMTAILPKMCGDLSWSERPIRLELTGLASGPTTMLLAAPKGRRDPAGGLEPACSVVSAAEDFEIWATQRRPWRDYDVTLAGDFDAAARFCDHVNVI